jgi:hypothetical protein
MKFRNFEISITNPSYQALYKLDKHEAPVADTLSSSHHSDRDISIRLQLFPPLNTRLLHASNNIRKTRGMTLENCLDLKQLYYDQDPDFFVGEGVKIWVARRFVSKDQSVSRFRITDSIRTMNLGCIGDMLLATPYCIVTYIN